MRYFPKVELHRHLEGMITFDTLYELAHRYNLGYDSDRETFRSTIRSPSDCVHLLSKVNHFWNGNLEDVYGIAHSAVTTCKQEGLFYLELRFSPELFTMGNSLNRSEIIKTIISAAEAAAKEINVQIRFLISFTRGRQNQFEMISLYQQLCELAIPSIVGIDLAGGEFDEPLEQFSEFLEYVHAKGMHKVTVHAEEKVKSQNIWFAIDALHASRIGHAVSPHKDKTLQRVLTSRKIALEQCITTDCRSASWKNEKSHPFGSLYRGGVPVTINSDFPSIQNTFLTDEYVKIAKTFLFSVDDFISCNKMAIEASFLEEHTKKHLQQQYVQRIDDFVSHYL